MPAPELSRLVATSAMDAVWTSFIQLYGYGLGFLYGTWQRRIRRREEAYTYRVTKFFSQKTR